MIMTTRQFSLDKKIYYRLLLAGYFRRNMRGYILIVALSIVGVIFGSTFLIIYGVAAAMLLAGYRSFLIYRYTIDLENRSFFVTRQVDVAGDSITVRGEDRSEAKFTFESIIRVARARDHYRLYMAKNLFHYIPFGAFETDAERVVFDKLLVDAGKLNT
jgi:hypothetical protein